MRPAIVAAVATVVLLLSACAPQSGRSAGEASGNAPVVAFYGDSYTLGTGTTDASRRWSTRLTESRGWREFNPSMNGLGFVNNREAFRADLPGMIIDAEPDIVIVTLGLNDVFSYQSAGSGIRRQIERDFERLRTALPDARFVVVEPFWYTRDRPASLEVIIGWVQDAAAGIGADYIPGASHWIQGARPRWRRTGCTRTTRATTSCSVEWMLR